MSDDGNVLEGLFDDDDHLVVVTGPNGTGGLVRRGFGVATSAEPESGDPETTSETTSLWPLGHEHHGLFVIDMPLAHIPRTFNTCKKVSTLVLVLDASLADVEEAERALLTVLALSPLAHVLVCVNNMNKWFDEVSAGGDVNTQLRDITARLGKTAGSESGRVTVVPTAFDADAHMEHLTEPLHVWSAAEVCQWMMRATRI